MNTWKEPGKGRKQCPACDLYVGVRGAVCECGHIFYATKPKPKKAEDELKETIMIPGGKCPVELTAIDKKTVMTWCLDVWAHHQGQKQKIAASTLKYYARYFYDVFSEEYATVCSHINTIEKTGSLDV